MYLREPYEVKKSKHNVTITPVFHKDAGGAVWEGHGGGAVWTGHGLGQCGWGSKAVSGGHGNEGGAFGRVTRGVVNDAVEAHVHT